jgi:hypothetical protein
MKRIYDIVDTGGFKPGETPADLKMVVEALPRGIRVEIQDLEGNVLSEGGADVPTLIAIGKASLLGMPVRVQSENNSRQ